MAMVFDRADSRNLWRGAEIPGDRRSNGCVHCGNLLIPDAKACQPAETTMRDRAALLVIGFATGSIFVSVRTFDHLVRNRAFGRQVLSRPPNRAAGRRAAHRLLPDYSGHALS